MNPFSPQQGQGGSSINPWITEFHKEVLYNITRGVPGAYCIIDPDGLIIDCNKEAADFFAPEIIPLTGKNFLNAVLSPVELASAKQVFTQVVSENKVLHHDLAENKWNSRFDRLTLIPITRQGIVSSVLIRFENTIAEALKIKDTRLPITGTGEPWGILTANTEGVITSFNPIITGILDLQGKEIMGQSWISLLNEQYWSVSLKTIMNLALAKGEWQGELVYTSPEKPPRNILLIAACYPATGDKKSMTLLFRDVTGKRQAIQQFRLLNIAAGKMYNSIIYTGTDRKIIWVNDAFTRNTGYTLEEVRGKKPGDILQGKDTNPNTVQWMAKKLANQETFDSTVLNYTKSGNPIWMHIQVQPVYDDAGQLIFYLGIGADITEQKELEKKIEAQKKIEKKKLVTAMIQGQEKERNEIGRELHDNINQILAVIKMNLDVLNNRLPAEERIALTKDLVARVIQEIRELSHRLVTPVKENTELGELLQSLVEQFMTGNSYKIKTDFNGLDKTKLSSSTSLHLYRVVQEQLMNITKHAAAVNVNITASKQDDHLYISVSDDGKGFDTSGKYQGIGLGNIFYRISLIGATGKIISTPGQGCTLQVHIPFENL